VVVWKPSPRDRLDDSLEPFRTSPRGTGMLGQAGPPTARATEAYTRYVITDMYARAAPGTPAAEAVNGAEASSRRSTGRRRREEPA
jgi:hypothetical protein